MFVGVEQLILVSGAAAQMNIPCGQRGDIINTLNDSYAEKPVATGLTQGGGNRFTSGSGSWTMIITMPTGRACLIGGPGAFLVVADDFKDFAWAIWRKLVFEIAANYKRSTPCVVERRNILPTNHVFEPGYDIGVRNLERRRQMHDNKL